MWKLSSDKKKKTETALRVHMISIGYNPEGCASSYNWVYNLFFSYWCSFYDIVHLKETIILFDNFSCRRVLWYYLYLNNVAAFVRSLLGVCPEWAENMSNCNCLSLLLFLMQGIRHGIYCCGYGEYMLWKEDWWFSYALIYFLVTLNHHS